MRLFLAINFEPSVCGAVYAAAAPLRALAPQAGWIPPARLHLTLKFLGEQPEGMVARVADAMDAVARRHRRIPGALRGFGLFPNFRRARVVFMGMDPDPPLELLHHDVERACDALGFPVEGRPFRPHVTLARLKHPIPADALQGLRRVADETEGASIVAAIRAIDLVRSTIRATGPEYEVVRTSPLRD